MKYTEQDLERADALWLPTRASVAQLIADARAEERERCGRELWNALVSVADEVQNGTLDTRDGAEVGMSVAGDLAKKWIAE